MTVEEFVAECRTLGALAVIEPLTLNTGEHVIWVYIYNSGFSISTSASGYAPLFSDAAENALEKYKNYSRRESAD